MKKKGMTYLLVFGVIAVWAIIIRKVVLSTQEEQIPQKEIGRKSNQQEALKWYMISYTEDSIDLQQVKRDPFSKKATFEIVQQEMPTVITPKTPVYQAPVNWPQIVFQGFSYKRAQKSGKYAILSINNQPYMLAEGEQALGVQLMKNWGDSLALSFQEKSKKFYLQTK